MATAYHVENIERITEQMIEEEILEETEDIRVDAINNINYVKEQLRKLDDEVNVIYQNTAKIADGTANTIEKDIRSMIVEKGYALNFVNDGNGNISATIKVVK